MDKVYLHKKYEEIIYKRWEDAGAFKPSDAKETFSIIMPPPNANGDLHLGHALMLTVEDIMIRYARQQGKAALWLPGTDHAGFETQVVYEKVLEKQGRSRLEMSREELYKEIWDFTQKNQASMIAQIKRLGSSCDWSRLKFTLDEEVIATVYQTFKKLYDDGLIYRGVRLVNYSPKFRTSFSDLEITHEEQRGYLWFIKYPLADGSGEIIVATTRPETMLGDTAVAVHPDDKRYQNLVGKKVKLPLCDREITIIADAAVDQKFGTGAVKVTPAHDFNDFEIGQRQKLESIQVIGYDGKLNENAPEKYRGLKASTDGREKVVADLEAAGLLQKVEEHVHQVPMGYKGGAIEPLPMEQWFVKMDGFAKRTKELIESKKITINPSRYQKILFQWLDNIRDWNISRQIVWGIPIPVVYCQNADCPPIVHTGQPPEKCPNCGGTELTAETDTFDTWFSSGQWVFATLGFDPATKKGSADFTRFMPTSVMETAADIIFFWVARMIFLTDYVTGQIPFKHVYLHGLVLDPKGQKMSKSKGNVLNPLELIEKYGADALRLALVAGNTPGSSQSFNEAKVIGWRNFTNKLWNIARFINQRNDSASPVASGEASAKPEKQSQKPPAAKTAADKQILAKLEDLTKQYHQLMSRERYNLVVEALYQFTWHDLADQYLETVKNQSDVDNSNQILSHVFDQLLTLLEPFAPFITTVLRD